MKQDIMKKWVKALRSGKYKQGQSYLKATWEKGDTRHCCLGVLCELYNNDMKKSKKKTLKEITNKDTVTHKFGRSETVLPSIVQKWAGLRTCDGEIKNDEGHIFSALTDMNDFGNSFQKIASFIEKHWKNI